MTTTTHTRATQELAALPATRPSRVVVEPVLGHEARGFEPPFPGASPGDGNDYGHLVSGPLEPGIQIGYCCSTGGGWSGGLVAHRSQIHPVSDGVSDEAAVMIEPTAVGVHAAMKARAQPGATVVVLGSGTMGLVTIAALRHLTEAATIIASQAVITGVNFAVAETGGGPNGAAFGPDGMIYVCNNGGIKWVEVNGESKPSDGLPDGYTSGSIQRVDPATSRRSPDTSGP